jgi:hypothetical protein
VQQQQVGMFAEIFWKEITVAASDLASKRAVINTARNSLERATQTSREITRAVRDATQDNFCRLSIRSRHVVERWRGLPRMLPLRNFSDIAMGPDELASIGGLRISSRHGWLAGPNGTPSRIVGRLQNAPAGLYRMSMCAGSGNGPTRLSPTLEVASIAQVARLYVTAMAGRSMHGKVCKCPSG